jgi:hypothetical protein
MKERQKEREANWMKVGKEMYKFTEIGIGKDTSRTNSGIGNRKKGNRRAEV